MMDDADRGRPMRQSSSDSLGKKNVSKIRYDLNVVSGKDQRDNS